MCPERKGVIDMIAINRYSKKRAFAAAALAAALATAGAAGFSSAAWADPGDPWASNPSNSGTTKVTVQADPDAVLAFRVPTLIPFYAAADGTLTGPSPEATQIVNESVFGIHVVKAQVEEAGGWTITSNAAAGGGAENLMDFQFGPEAQLDAAAALTGSDTSDDVTFNMGYSGSATDAINIETQGDVGRVTKDMSVPNQTATITWTVAPGYAE